MEEKRMKIAKPVFTLMDKLNFTALIFFFFLLCLFSSRILDPNKAKIFILSTTSRLAAIQYIAMCCNSLHLASLWLRQDGEDGVDVTKLISKTCQLLHIPVENTKGSLGFVFVSSCFAHM